MTAPVHGPGRSWSRWLPDAALNEAVPGSEIDEALRAWSLRWFAGGMVHGLGAWAPIDAKDGPTGGTRSILAGRLRLTLHTGGEARIGELMVGKPPADAILTEADRRQIAASVAACLADLRRALASASGVAGEWSGTETCDEWATGRTLTTRTGAAIGTMAIARDLLVERRLGEGRPSPAVALAGRGEAVGAQTVRVAARVGAAVLTLVDFGALRRGDVVLLDRPIGEPLDLMIEEQAVPAACQLSDAGDTFLLHL